MNDYVSVSPMQTNYKIRLSTDHGNVILDVDQAEKLIRDLQQAIASPLRGQYAEWVASNVRSTSKTNGALIGEPGEPGEPVFCFRAANNQ